MHGVECEQGLLEEPCGNHASGNDRGPRVSPGERSPAEAPPSQASTDQLQTRFGPLPLDPNRQIRFRGGLPGFPEIERFQLDPLPGIETELLLLQAVDNASVGFITLPLPETLDVLSPADVASVGRMLDIEPGELMVLAIVKLAESKGRVDKYLNLRAPLFIDARRKVGAQVVLANPSYPMRHRLAPEAA
jgi:flagellar assembly factor FliW